MSCRASSRKVWLGKVSACCALANAWIRDRKGVVAPLYALMAVAMFLTMGGALDFARWANARQHTIKAMDAAVLAGGRVLQLDSSATAEAIDTAERFYAENTKGRLELLSDTIAFTVSDDGLSFSATGNAEIETLLLGFAHISKLKLLDAAGSEYSKAEIAASGQSDYNLEISMMLDVTGSMWGSKLSDMQEAAKDLIEIVVWDDQSEHTSRVAIVPFSQAVNVGSTYFNAITNKNTNSTLASRPEGLWPSVKVAIANIVDALSPVSPAQAGNGNNGNGNGNNGNNGNGGDDNDGNSGGGSSHNYDSCVVDRTGNAALTDDAPGPGKYLGVYDIEKQSNWWTQDMACRPSSVTIQPLTSDKTVLTDKIDDFVASGYTAGHIGTAFAWFMLSPNWSDVWAAESEPAAYTDTDTKKIAILLTDGDYNTWYNGNGNGSASEQAEAICENMKDEGITVYTIGFDISDGSDAADVMANCATDAGKSYSADDGAELKQAFRDIALSISTIYLSN